MVVSIFDDPGKNVEPYLRVQRDNKVSVAVRSEEIHIADESRARQEAVMDADHEG